MPLFKNAATFNIFVFVCLCYMVNGNDDCDIGTCLEVLDCPSALHAIHSARGMHNLERCGWNHKSEKVCCLDPISTSSTITDDGTSSSSSKEEDKITSTTMASTSSTQSNVVRGNARKSEEACQRYSANMPFQVNYHILNGEAAAEGEFPHMAALGYRNTEGGTDLMWICGGSIISDKFILTAAHCVTSRRRPVRVLMGVLNITEQLSTRLEYDIANITMHPQYRRQNHDIALIEVSNVIDFSANVYPACLYQRNDDPIGMIITGWGKTQTGQLSEILLKARVAPVSIATCNETFVRNTQPLNEGHICTGSITSDVDKQTDSCPGDSGGPLQVLAPDNLMYQIVGVVSFGLTDCGGGAPSVYTRVYQYLDWIEPIVWP